MTDGEAQAEIREAPSRPQTIWTRLGVALLGMSLLLWLPLPAVPFLSITGAQKAALGGSLLVSAEVAFWLGALLAGPEAARRMRSWIRLRKRDADPSS